MDSGHQPFVAQASVSRQALERAKRLALTPVPVLILGPDGSGRKRLAEEMHLHSAVKDGPLRKLECDLQKGEPWQIRIYGDREKKGLFESAAGGTLLLREIDGAPTDLQAHLARILEDGHVSRERDDEQRIPIQCRILATGANDGDLHQSLRNVVAAEVIRLLPLCDRREDIPPLFHHFLRFYNERCGKSVNPPNPELLEALCLLPWKGNVQELENAVKTVVQKGETKEFSTSLLPDIIHDQLQSAFRGPSSSSGTLLLADAGDKLIDSIHTLTFRTIEGGLHALPATFLGCDEKDVQQSLAAAIIKGTVRACEDWLATNPSDIDDLGPMTILAGFGLKTGENALHDAIAHDLELILSKWTGIKIGAAPRSIDEFNEQFKRAAFLLREPRLCLAYQSWVQIVAFSTECYDEWEQLLDQEKWQAQFPELNPLPRAFRRFFRNNPPSLDPQGDDRDRRVAYYAIKFRHTVLKAGIYYDKGIRMPNGRSLDVPNEANWHKYLRDARREMKKHL
jgi:hypothetical protein